MCVRVFVCVCVVLTSAVPLVYKGRGIQYVTVRYKISLAANR